jgi:antitoxin CptB
LECSERETFTAPKKMTIPTLRWRMRRGMKELDVLFERYQARRHAAAPAAEQAALARLLEREDPEIWQWVMGQSEPPAEFADVIQHLRRPG